MADILQQFLELQLFSVEGDDSRLEKIREATVDLGKDLTGDRFLPFLLAAANPKVATDAPSIAAAAAALAERWQSYTNCFSSPPIGLFRAMLLQATTGAAAGNDGFTAAAAQFDWETPDGDFTEALSLVWNGGMFRGNYCGMTTDIAKRLRRGQKPVLLSLGAPNPGFATEQVFKICARHALSESTSFVRARGLLCASDALRRRPKKTIRPPGGLGMLNADSVVTRLTTAVNAIFGDACLASWLSGSFAYGGARPGKSDIDVVLVFDARTHADEGTLTRIHRFVDEYLALHHEAGLAPDLDFPRDCLAEGYEVVFSSLFGMMPTNHRHFLRRAFPLARECSRMTTKTAFRARRSTPD